MLDPETQPEQSEETGEETEGEEAEGADQPRRQKEPRKQPTDFQDTAVQNLLRARRGLVSPDGEVNPRAQLLIQSSIAYAVLDLAEAIRSHAPPGRRRAKTRPAAEPAPLEESPETAEESAP